MSEQNSGKVTITDTVGAAALTKYELVKTPGALVVCAAATDDCVGIVEDGYAIGAQARVVLQGLTKARASTTITKGDVLEAAADGEVATHSTTSTKPVIGRALESATAQGDFIDILLFPQGGTGLAA